MADRPATLLMTSGGDARILLDPATGLNRYHSAPRPSPALAYASSTANDISAPAFAHVEALLERIAPEGRLAPGAYAAELEGQRKRIRAAYALPDDVEIVFAPSGTDLEYVALACTTGKAANGTHNILLGADEVGSGCIYSAHGQYFAEQTALGLETSPGDPVPGLDAAHVSMVDIPVRDAEGHVRRSGEMLRRIGDGLARATAQGRHPLVHVVHGSKTGLVLPTLSDLDRLRRENEGITFAVDACQARITPCAIADYLSRDMIVFITGSKFMGGPPFSGLALVPRALAEAAGPLPEGLATIFRRAEWPQRWPGAGILPEGANLGLLLRLEAALFELERFQALPAKAVARTVLAFHAAVHSEIVEPLGVRRLEPYPPGDRAQTDSHPIEMRTLSTLDLTPLGGASFEDAQAWQRALLGHGVRLGQPVKCVKLPGSDGRWGATLRIGLSMPGISERAALDGEALERSLTADMRTIADALRAVAA